MYLVLVDAIDRSKEGQVNVFILGTKAMSSVSVHVLDVNDNRPSFTSSKFNGHISETATVGSLILKSTETYNPLGTIHILRNHLKFIINSLLNAFRLKKNLEKGRVKCYVKNVKKYVNFFIIKLKSIANPNSTKIWIF